MRRVLNALILLLSTSTALACGSYSINIPTPDFFGMSGPGVVNYDYDRDENLRLWQAQTDAHIPLADIEQAVYRDSRERFGRQIYKQPGPKSNKFYNYLDNTLDTEAKAFLYVAKELAEAREAIASPWYYPASRDEDVAEEKFRQLFDRCRNYRGTRFADRYALQGVRALFAWRRYADCIEYCDSAFAAFPDSNLFKRMARRYEAGCWARIGQTERVDTCFALAGDVYSVTDSLRVEYMARLNPDAPQFIGYVRSNSRDSAFMAAMIPVANRLLADGRVRNRGDWFFTLAYAAKEYLGNLPQARQYISKALRQGFYNEEFRDLARVYRMKLDAEAGDGSRLEEDLRWFLAKYDSSDWQAQQWSNRLENIIYSVWVPRLWRQEKYARAILLCSFADYFKEPGRRYWKFAKSGEFDGSWWIQNLTLAQMRQSETYFNEKDYGCLSFQLMGSLSSVQLAQVYREMMQDTPLNNLLRRNMRTDRDYYYELIGTLALREADYSRAVDYFSRVSERYMRTLNTFPYLDREPFAANPPYPGGNDAYGSVYGPGTTEKGCPRPDAKLDFARRMLTYSRAMRDGTTADERARARLLYAVGRRNSFNRCWALTQYWRGFYLPTLYYLMFEYSFTELDDYDFLYDYDVDDYEDTEAVFEREVREALAMFRSDEERAKAEYFVGNLKSVVRRYPDTQMAEYVRTSCDRWRNWL